MNYGPILFLGILALLASSWYTFIFAPIRQLLPQQPVAIADPPLVYPVRPGGLVRQGQDVYRANGCAYCHTQQVRPREFGGDIERGWGVRRSVAQDFLYQDLVLLGKQRVGPDLANIGSRQPSAEWHLAHLYHPHTVVPGSVMPAYPYLFAKRRDRGSANALKLSGRFAPETGFEIVPTPEAEALVAYLLSLRSDVPLFEAPLPAPKGAATNAPPAGATNAAPGAPSNPAPP